MYGFSSYRKEVLVTYLQFLSFRTMFRIWKLCYQLGCS